MVFQNRNYILYVLRLFHILSHNAKDQLRVNQFFYQRCWNPALVLLRQTDLHYKPHPPLRVHE